MAEQHSHRYLGDGVYASFDGFHIWLRTGSHTSEPAIALEPAVFDALVRYRGELYEAPKRGEKASEPQQVAAFMARGRAAQEAVDEIIASHERTKKAGEGD
jgi:hypothetical protein